MILPHPLHTFKTGDTFVGATVEGGNLVLGETRNEEAANEGRFPQLLTVIPLQEAIAMAKAILASQEGGLQAYIEELGNRYQDYQALVDSSLEHDIVY